MSQMPNKIWVHKNTKYSTGDIVCGYQYDFVQGIEDEGGIENFVEYVPADAFMKKAKEAFCKATCNGCPPRSTCTSLGTCKGYDDFVKYMKGE